MAMIYKISFFIPFFVFCYISVLSQDGKYALTIREDRVGFEKYNPESEDQRIKLEKNTL